MRRMRLGRTLPTLGAAAWALSAAQADGGATTIPDAAQMTAFRQAVARGPVLLVRGGFGLREIHDPWLDSTGVGPARQESARRPRPALFTTADAPRPPVSATVPWSEISTLETQRPRKLQGAIAGLVVGLALGVTLASQDRESYTGDLRRVGLLTAVPPGGVLVGTLLGSLSGTKVIYRAPTQEND